MSDVMKDFKDLFANVLKPTYNAEQQLLRVL